MKYFDFKSTANGPINKEFGSSDADWEILGFRLHLTTALAQATAVVNLTITGQASNDTATEYKFNLLTHAMAGTSDLAWYPDPPVPMKQGDFAALAWVNDASSYKKYALEILWREV